MRCRFLYLIGQLGVGGSERQLVQLACRLQRGGQPAAVVVWNGAPGDLYEAELHGAGVEVYRLRAHRSRLAKLLALRRLVRALRPEVLHSYSFYTNFAAAWACAGSETVAVGSLRSGLDFVGRQYGAILRRLSARWPRCQIANSRRAAEQARGSNSRFLPRRIIVVRNGIDLASFPEQPLPENGEPIVLGLGSLLPVKRWEHLLAATHRLQRDGLNFRLRLVGDGPLRETLLAQARSCGLDGRVELRGHAADVPAVLAEAAFLVHPSESEGCPNAVMEAMACGRAVIATDVGDVPDLVEDGKTGYVVPAGDQEALIRRIAELVRGRSLCRRMGAAGRAKAEREFGLERMVGETLAAYRAAGWDG